MKQKILKIITILFFAAFLTACSADDLIALLDESESVQEDVAEEEVTISRVVDGDTVKVEMADGQEETVRLLLVDTPESVHPNKPKQPYGEEASQYAKVKLSEGKKVKLEYDGPKRGNYDRLLAYIWVDGDNFNQELLEKGYARYAYEYDPSYKYQDEFKAAENEAKEADKRIWSIDGFVESEFEEW